MYTGLELHTDQGNKIYVDMTNLMGFLNSLKTMPVSERRELRNLLSDVCHAFNDFSEEPSLDENNDSPIPGATPIDTDTAQDQGGSIPESDRR